MIAFTRVFCLLALALAASYAFGQSWPSKSIRWIVPFAPGGSNDITARVIAERLSESFGQAVIVDNRPGAAGTIGVTLAAKSAPDGYTLVSCSDTIAASPHLYPTIGFHPIRDFAPVTQLARFPVVLTAHPSLGVHTVGELVALIKRKPGLGYASAGTGTQQHFAGEWFASIAGIKLTHVPYKGGGQAITDLLGGQVQLAMLGAGPVFPYYKSGKLALLAQTTDKRSPFLPDVPTFLEAGIKGLVIEQWQGVFLPANTPAPIVTRLYAEIAKALANEKVRERFAQNGLEIVGSTPEQFAAAVRMDYEKYGGLMRKLNIKSD